MSPLFRRRRSAPGPEAALLARRAELVEPSRTAGRDLDRLLGERGIRVLERQEAGRVVELGDVRCVLALDPADPILLGEALLEGRPADPLALLAEHDGPSVVRHALRRDGRGELEVLGFGLPLAQVEQHVVLGALAELAERLPGHAELAAELRTRGGGVPVGPADVPAVLAQLELEARPRADVPGSWEVDTELGTVLLVEHAGQDVLLVHLLARDEAAPPSEATAVEHLVLNDGPAAARVAVSRLEDGRWWTAATGVVPAAPLRAQAVAFVLAEVLRLARELGAPR